HELRTPLAVMRANLDSLERRAGEDSELAVPLERIRRTVGDMEKLLETLLILAREDESRLPREGVIINDLLSERISQLGRAMGDDGARINLHAECLLQIHAPTRVLAIIFDNIIRNAVRYSDDDTVSVRVAPGLVEVRDRGPGMDEQLLKHVFEPFHRGDSSEPGFGLGLAIVKRLCDRFGWSVEIDTAVGRGTTVKILLPDAEVIGQKR
ncbi:MAG: HAMP domain-containing histidine kinase, partial [Xanthomonadales bacterium]|nr:HAMP domain-containing histidine kinase [Xanthomonadales bacterium]